jgi:glycosyltransferase involved in cell wall biosynthesis
MLYYSAPEWTGSARVFVAAGRGLAARGYQVTFVCPGGGSVEARAAAEGCDVIPLDAGGSLAGRSWHLQRILTQRFVETVFVHTQSEQLAVAIAMRMAGRGGVVRRIPPGAPPNTGRATRFALRLASGGFVCTSAADAELVREIPRARAPVIADLGVDAARYDELRAAPAPSVGAAPNARVVVCVCEPNQPPRVASVLRTMALLAPRHPELHLALLGPGPGNEDVRMHAAALGLTRRVSCLGERDDDLAVLRAAEVGWVVAGEDTAAYAALDFMAMGTPVLTDRATIAARYISNGITGAILTPGDIPAAAATLAALLAQHAQRTAMGNAGRARVAREYTESAMLDRLQEAADMGRDRSQWSG